MKNITHLLFDWGDTLMADDATQTGAMAYWSEVRVCGGVLELMPQLSKKYICAVVTNAADSDGELMKKAFERVNLAQYFTFFLTSKELGAKKPESDFFIKAAEIISAKPHSCIMIGNSYSSDICGAKEAGMTTTLITSETGDFPLADYVTDNFGNLKNLLLAQSI